MSNMRALACSILRGGTSRGVFFLARDLPQDRAAIDPILLNVFGSPDVRQINGLGGATSQTSKAAIIGPPSRPDADVDYTFAQISVTDPLVDWGGNCGNISSAVGPFAIDAGLVPVTEGTTVVRIHNTNTAKIIVARVPVHGGRAVVEGDFAIPGVPGTGARIDLEFTDPAGSFAQSILPTGKATDQITLADGRTVRVSIVDAANPVAFALAEDLGARGNETPAEMERNRGLTDALEEIRAIAAEWIGVVKDRRDALSTSPGLPKVGMVAPPSSYTTSTGREVGADSMDLNGRLMSMQTAHRSYMVTGAICTAAAAMIRGTVVHQVTRPADDRPERDRIRIGNPYGVMDTLVAWHEAADEITIDSVSVGRTARHLLDGRVWVPSRLLPAEDEGLRGDDPREVLAAV